MPLTEQEYQLPIADRETQKILLEAPAFSEYLAPFADVDGRYILMRDLATVGLLFDVLPISAEGRDAASIEGLLNRAIKAFANLPETPTGNWMLQFFLQDEQSLEPLVTHLISYIPPNLLKSQFSQDWLHHLEQHLEQVGQSEGLFFDSAVGNAPWRGRLRRVRACLWFAGEGDVDIDQVAQQLGNNLAQVGATLKCLRPVELYAWLSRWFVPRLENGQSVERFIRARPWRPTPLALLGERDLAAASLHGTAPKTLDGNWYFRGMPSRFIALEACDDLPTGVLTSEQSIGAHRRVLWDTMPPGSVFSMTVIAQSQEEISEHIRRVQLNSVGDKPAAMAKRALADEVIAQMAGGEKLLRCFAGVFVRGETLAALNKHCSTAVSLLGAFGLNAVPPADDLLAQDSFVRGLPFNFDLEHDQRIYVKRSRFWFARDCARLAPLFGRSTGTGNPGLVFFNRGAEPLTFDPLADRKRNAHALVLGPTGSGKTSLLIYMLLQLLAVHKPRLFLVSALPTFELLAQHLRRLGLSVHHVHVGEDDVSLPPFADANEIGQASDARDVLTDLELAATLMITGGDPAEAQHLRRHDRSVIRDAIERAAATHSPVLTEHVVGCLRELGKKDASIRDKARAMELFCTGFPGQLFNRSGELWPDADVTIFQLGPLASEGAKDYLSVAITSLIARINAIVRREQYSTRQTITVVDEAHILLQNPLIAPYLNSIAAMWRTFGSWLWIATQTLKQFTEKAQELLAQPEWWICMTMDESEVREIAARKSLTAEERALLNAARKEAGKYTEGVILSDAMKTLFRSVVPAIALALSQTEKDEKANRAKIMREQGIDELAAVYQIAEKIQEERAG